MIRKSPCFCEKNDWKISPLQMIFIKIVQTKTMKWNSELCFILLL